MAKECPWEEIQFFHAYSEVIRFLHWIEEQVAGNNALEVEVIEKNLMNERWFKHIASKTIWCFMPPDGPFRGAFSYIGVDDDNRKTYFNFIKWLGDMM